MIKKRILVFPCGSEIGLEIHRSMRYSAHFELVGASSVDDHGRFVFENYINDHLPLHDDPNFVLVLKRILKKYSIDAIYPTMDAVADTIKQLEKQLDTIVIGSSKETTHICASKAKTYDKLKGKVSLPQRFLDLDSVLAFPIFIKPDCGYGSKNTLVAYDMESAQNFLTQFLSSDMLLLEYLPGNEWTIDCFSDQHGKLHFYEPRVRARIRNGISVRTFPSNDHKSCFAQWAKNINDVLRPRGAWFFQAKLDNQGSPKLLEVAARLGGSSSLFRCLGINFALLSAFDAFGFDVSVNANFHSIEMDRALNNKYRIRLEYDRVYVDLDDCLIINNKVNLQLISFLHHAINQGKLIILLTRHATDPLVTLRCHRIEELFDEVIHLQDYDISKTDYICTTKSIFIDDSYVERKEVMKVCGISTFSPDMVESLY